MRIACQFQRMRQYHQVQAARRKRQSREIGHNRRARRRHIGKQPAMRHAVGSQCVQFAQTQLHGMESKNIGDSQIKLGTLPRQQITARGCRKPRRRTYNLIVHEAHSTQRLR